MKKRKTKLQKVEKQKAEIIFVKFAAKMRTISLITFFSAILAPNLAPIYGFGVAEVTEVISVVRIGVGLVEYIYKVFSSILVRFGLIFLNGPFPAPFFLLFSSIKHKCSI